jgi:hypothetical protein
MLIYNFAICAGLGDLVAIPGNYIRVQHVPFLEKLVKTWVVESMKLTFFSSSLIVCHLRLHSAAISLAPALTP